ncbi:MAG: glycosyltransferase family 39 protein, partial [Chloroflexi bacterium]|nr:glycosyltransferase family 39 protein [Chloroflexota bacterium]
MSTITLPSQLHPSTLAKRILPGVTIGALIVAAIMIASFALHIYNIESIGYANEYYTAAVEAMLKSWSNFFFVAAEPGGSVTVDKPPLGLWIQAVFAYFLGVSGFSVTLPNILAGVFGIGLLYHMVKKYMGELAGITAAFVMAITPVFIATNRNNTMDGMLVFTLLLAAWAFIKATESGKARWLLLGAFIVGLGFNIKMLQAFLPLPAFYALYFFGSKEGWFKKILNLGIATILLIAVSLSWAVAVDLVPAEN